MKIHNLLINAPKTIRQRYGPRHEQSAHERMQLCKDRNRAHAKATRQRKKVFEQVINCFLIHFFTPHLLLFYSKWLF